MKIKTADLLEHGEDLGRTRPKLTGVSGRKFNGTRPLKLRRIKAQPRTRIRELLKSFDPPDQFLSR